MRFEAKVCEEGGIEQWLFVVHNVTCVLMHFVTLTDASVNQQCKANTPPPPPMSTNRDTDHFVAGDAFTKGVICTALIASTISQLGIH